LGAERFDIRQGLADHVRHEGRQPARDTISNTVREESAKWPMNGMETVVEPKEEKKKGSVSDAKGFTRVREGWRKAFYLNPRGVTVPLISGIGEKRVSAAFRR